MIFYHTQKQTYIHTYVYKYKEKVYLECVLRLQSKKVAKKLNIRHDNEQTKPFIVAPMS